jgi:NADH:ubiquinone oxidoreductase subunit 4 (subunit M)
MMTFPFLSSIVFIPAIGSLILLLLPAQKKNLARGVALGAAILDLTLSATVYVQ